MFPCVIQGTLTPTTAGYSGSLKTTSKGGTINSNFGLTPSAVEGLYTLNGSGTENETERGVTTTNDATMTGTVKVTTSPRTITGVNIKVSEVSTVP